MDPLLEFINQCYSIALSNGLSEDLPVVIEYGNDEDFPIKIVVSNTEPVDLTLPLNVIWIVSNDANVDDYFSALIRSSKDLSSNYDHTWSKASALADITSLSQYYEGNDRFRVGALQAVNNLRDENEPFPDRYLRLDSNGVLQGSLTVRELSNSQGYGLTEAIPRRTLVDALNSQTQGFYTILMGMNTRLNAAEQKIANHESRIIDLELGGGGGNSGGQLDGARYYVHVQNELESEWIINHQLDTKNIIVQVWRNDEIDPALPEQATLSEVITEEKIVFSKDFILVRFSIPMTGRVVISTFGLEPI